MLVGKQPDRDSVGSLLKDVYVGVEYSISRNVHLDIMLDAFIGDL